MKKRTDLPETKLAITHTLTHDCGITAIVHKTNEIIGKINFLDEHINFLYDRSRTQYNSLVDQGKGLQNVYDEFHEFKKRFEIIQGKRKQKAIGTTLDLLEHTSNN